MTALLVSLFDTALIAGRVLLGLLVVSGVVEYLIRGRCHRCFRPRLGRARYCGRHIPGVDG